jgi:hypothetical protein
MVLKVSITGPVQFPGDLAIPGHSLDDPTGTSALKSECASSADGTGSEQRTVIEEVDRVPGPPFSAPEMDRRTCSVDDLHVGASQGCQQQKSTFM